ncbi:MAG: RDD family protein [Nevskiaceae bacterium]
MSQEVLTIRTLDAVDVHLARAGIGSRSYAFLIDWHIRLLAALAWIAGGMLVAGADFKTSVTAYAFGVGLPAALIYFLYHPVLEIAMQGQTPGKRWIHLRIVTTDGSTPGVGALLVRNVFRLLDSMPALYALGLLVMLCTRDQVRIGDLAAGTLVVYDAPPAKESLADAAVHDAARARVVPLLEEWLERWPDLEPPQRDEIARGLLRKAGAEAGVTSDGEVLREHVKRWLDGNARAV